VTLTFFGDIYLVLCEKPSIVIRKGGAIVWALCLDGLSNMKQYSQPVMGGKIGRLFNNHRECCPEFLVHCNTHCCPRSHKIWRLIEGVISSLCAFRIALGFVFVLQQTLVSNNFMFRPHVMFSSLIILGCY